MKKKFWTDKKRYINLTERIPLRVPLSLLIEPTNRCNFQCIYCPDGNKEILKESKRPMGDMDLKLFQKIVSDIQGFSGKIERISLYKDGEPLLHSDLPEMVRLLKNCRVCNEVSITSNAILLTRELAFRIIDAGLDSIRFSVISVSDEGYKRLARVDCGYETIRQKIKLFNKIKHELNKQSPSIYIKIIDFNLSDKEKQKFYSDFSIISDEISIEAPMNWDGSHGRDFMLGQERNVFLGRRDSLRRSKVCPRPWYTMAINFNGKVSVCCVDWNHKTIIGDVNKESLIDIWSGNNMHEFRRMHAEMRRREHPSCNNCGYIIHSQDNSDLDILAKNDINKLLTRI